MSRKLILPSREEAPRNAQVPRIAHPRFEKIGLTVTKFNDYI